VAPRTVIVGDVHGCSQELDDLLLAVRFAPGTDRLVFVGDLVARGPDSRGAVDRARALGARAVRGNHDEKVLSWWRARKRHGEEGAHKLVPLSDRHRAVVDTLDEDHFAWLDALPLHLPLPEHDLVVVHAGVDPQSTPEKSPQEVLLLVRSIDPTGKPTRMLEGVPWAQAWGGPRQLVFGHDARRGLQLEPHATGLDTGCCYGRALTALVLSEGQRLSRTPEARRRHLRSVPSRRVWCPPGNGDGAE
jgi:hypothetical protein